MIKQLVRIVCTNDKIQGSVWYAMLSVHSSSCMTAPAPHRNATLALTLNPGPTIDTRLMKMKCSFPT